MAIRAVVFDMGGVLEITTETGWGKRWEQDLGLQGGELNRRLTDVWRGGSIGALTEAEVEASIQSIIGFDQPQLTAFMNDLWAEYLLEH